MTPESPRVAGEASEEKPLGLAYPQAEEKRGPPWARGLQQLDLAAPAGPHTLKPGFLLSGIQAQRIVPMGQRPRPTHSQGQEILECKERVGGGGNPCEVGDSWVHAPESEGLRRSAGD